MVRSHEAKKWGPTRCHATGEFAANRLGIGPRSAIHDRLKQLCSEIDFDRKLEATADRF